MALLKEITDPDNLKAINSAVDSLEDNESVALAQAASAGIARLEAIRFRALAQLDRHREGARSVAQEVAFALSVGDRYAAGLVAAADALTTRLPRTLGLMDKGQVDGFGAMKVVTATAWLSDEDAIAADALLEDRMPGKNAEQIRKAANHAAATVDREGADKRCEQAREGRRLVVSQGEAGVASLEIEDGPVDMDLFTYLGLNDDPAEMAGHGHIPASLARHIASGPNTVLRRIITDPLSGQVADLGRDRYRPTAGLDEFVRVRDRECRRPGCHRPAQACDLDHSIPWQFQGNTDAADIIDFCRRDHRLKDEPGWIYRLAPDGTLTITTPTGQAYDSKPPPLHTPRTEEPSF